MMITAFHNLQLISDGSIARGKAVLIDGEKIIDIVDETSISEGVQKTDLNGAFLAPGLIDLQIYGSGGKLFAGKPEISALERMENDLLKQGTIGFFATIGTNTDEIVEQGIAAAKTYRNNNKGNFWGLHLEGPFLNPIRKAHIPRNILRKHRYN